MTIENFSLVIFSKSIKFSKFSTKHEGIIASFLQWLALLWRCRAVLRGGDTLSNFYNFYELAVPVFFQLSTFFVSIHTFLILLGGVKGHYFLPPQNRIWNFDPPHDPTPGEYIIPLNRQWWIPNDFKTWPFSIKSLISVEGNSSFKEWFGSFFSRKPSSPNE